MKNKIIGLHHVSAIATDAKTCLSFYRDLLGMRFIKKTINFDDPSGYHLYFSNQHAEPGSVLTFFPLPKISKGRRGLGQATEIGLSVAPGSFPFWVDRFKENGVIYNNPSKRFNESYLTFLDPDGLKFELVEADNDDRIASQIPQIRSNHGIKGFRSVTLTLADHVATAEVLVDLFGYKLESHEVNRFRYVNSNISTANVIDIVVAKGEKNGVVAGGSVHHIAFRVSDEETQHYFRKKVAEAGLNVTEQKDRKYFKAIYFREPGGVLFEISTDTPGFTVDEPQEELGSKLMLPAQFETRREEIEKNLPILK